MKEWHLRYREEESLCIVQDRIHWMKYNRHWHRSMEGAGYLLHFAKIR